MASWLCPWQSLSVTCACYQTKAGGSCISQAGCSIFVCWEDSLFSIFLKVRPEKVLSWKFSRCLCGPLTVSGKDGAWTMPCFAVGHHSVSSEHWGEFSGHNWLTLNFVLRVLISKGSHCLQARSQHCTALEWILSLRSDLWIPHIRSALWLMMPSSEHRQETISWCRQSGRHFFLIYLCSSVLTSVALSF